MTILVPCFKTNNSVQAREVLFGKVKATRPSCGLRGYLFWQVTILVMNKLSILPQHNTWWVEVVTSNVPPNTLNNQRTTKVRKSTPDLVPRCPCVPYLVLYNIMLYYYTPSTQQGLFLWEDHDVLMMGFVFSSPLAGGHHTSAYFVLCLSTY